MASYVDNFKNNKLDWAMPFQRTGQFPLDRTDLFYSLGDAEAYAKGDGTDERELGGSSYIGQIITVFASNSVNVYKINANRQLEEISSGPYVEEQIKKLRDEIGNLNRVMNFRGSFETFDSAEAREKPEAGDVIVITTEDRDADPGSIWICDSIDNSVQTWKELGTVNESDLLAHKILFVDDLKLTRPFGRYGTADDPKSYEELLGYGLYTIPSKNRSIEDVIKLAYSYEPAIEIVLQTRISGTEEWTDKRTYEVGSIIDIKFEFIPNSNSELIDPSDAAASWSEHRAYIIGSLDFDDVKKSASFYSDDLTSSLLYKEGQSGIFENIQINEFTDFNIKGVVKGKFKLSEDNEIEREIVAKYNDKNFKGYRAAFIGTLSSKDKALDSFNSLSIRKLDNQIMPSVDGGLIKFESDGINNNIYRLFISIPSYKKIKYILDGNDNKSNIYPSFKKFTSDKLQINGQNDYFSINYDIYYLDAAISLKSNTYYISIYE